MIDTLAGSFSRLCNASRKRGIGQYGTCCQQASSVSMSKTLSWALLYIDHVFYYSTLHIAQYTQYWPRFDMVVPDQGRTIDAVCDFLIIGSVLATCLRFLSRKLSQSGFWWDDWLALAALVRTH